VNKNGFRDTMPALVLITAILRNFIAPEKRYAGGTHEHRPLLPDPASLVSTRGVLTKLL
jgi:hypothetical protein